jgi:hypothetical protein
MAAAADTPIIALFISSSFAFTLRHGDGRVQDLSPNTQ